MNEIEYVWELVDLTEKQWSKLNHADKIHYCMKKIKNLNYFVKTMSGIVAEQIEARKTITPLVIKGDCICEDKISDPCLHGEKK